MSRLITGNLGFIGTNLSLRTGWDGIDKETDIRDIDNIKEALKGYDTIIHLAAKAGVKQSIANEPDYVDTNIAGTFNISKVCWEQGKRLIFASSSSVTSGLSPYAKTKQGCEDVINAFRRHGLNAVNLRFYTVFGEYNRKDMAVYKFTQAIRNEEPIELYGDCRRDFTYVQDLCRAIVKISDRNLEGTYDLGFGEPITVEAMINALYEQIGGKLIIKRKPQREFDPVETKADPALMNELGIKQTPLTIALKNTLKTI